MRGGCFTPSAGFRRPFPGERGFVIALADGAVAMAGDHEASAGSLFIGELNGYACFAADLNECPLPDARPLREIIGGLEMPLRQAVFRAGTIAFWSSHHRFCGVCGRRLAPGTLENSLFCENCKAAYFPQIAPAVIVAVERDGRLLLARNARFRSGVFGLVAGFVEAGESLEEAVRRELAEEVKVAVRDIRYAGSQPWPFPNSLMIGFTACHLSGEPTPDGGEIVEAGFFAPEEFPPVPGPGSIARRLIDEFVRKNAALRGAPAVP